MSEPVINMPRGEFEIWSAIILLMRTTAWILDKMYSDQGVFQPDAHELLEDMNGQIKRMNTLLWGPKP